MSMRRVVITGIGVISALGLSTAEFWAALREGLSGIAPIESVDVSKLRFHNGAEVRGYDVRAHFDDGKAFLTALVSSP
jgi:3-oxoacyl-(acyl-carrier-protein) synthase